MLAAASSIALGFALVIFLAIGLSIYLAVAWQISARRAIAASAETISPKTFDLPEALLAGVLIFLLSASIIASFGRTPLALNTPELVQNFLLQNFLISFAIVLFIALFLKLRGINIDSLAGFSKTTLKRAVSTAIILLLAATPLILLAEALTQNLFGSGSSRQEIVDLFNSSRTLQQRVMIIFLAIVVAPISEEFIFRFFIYGVVRRYFGIAIGLVFNAALFAAAHNHLPSAAPLFVLGACFTLAYEWSGSILVSMSMHALFNSVQLSLLAFPNFFQQ
jgi:uncharacterized protein